MSFKDRFRDRNEVIGRDGSNSFAPAKSQATHQSRQSAVPPLQPAQAGSPAFAQQQQQYGGGGGAYGGGGSAVPSIGNPYAGGPGLQPAPGPSFFMTGGGFPAVPTINFNPYGATSVPQLPPLAGPSSIISYGPGVQQQGGDPYAMQQQYASQPLNAISPTQASPSQAASGAAQKQRAPAGYLATSLDFGPESPTSNDGRPRRRKDPLPDFNELAALAKDRHHGQRSVERMPVLIDHPHGGEYHEHNLREYRRMVAEYKGMRWGGLGPEDSEHKQMMREKKKKIMDYAKQVNAVNFALMDVVMGDEWHHRPLEKRPTLDAQLGQIKRQRAAQYADAVKPPKVSARSVKAKTPQPVVAERGESQHQLETLEEKHKRDQEAIMRIKAQLNMLA